MAAAVAGALAVQLVLVGTALADTATPEPPVSPSTQAIDDIYRVVLGVCVTIFVLVVGWLVYASLRFRQRRGDPDEEPPQVHGSTKLEIGWTIAPILVLVGLSAYTFANLPEVESPPDDAMDVRIDAFQYGWRYTYPDGASTEQALVVPVDQAVELHVTASDVNHDWWVPELAPKTDAIDGQMNETWMRPEEIGTYTGQCAELCGPGHPTMGIEVRVVSAVDFDRFMAGLEREGGDGGGGSG